MSTAALCFFADQNVFGVTAEPELIILNISIIFGLQPHRYDTNIGLEPYCSTLGHGDTSVGHNQDMNNDLLQNEKKR